MAKEKNENANGEANVNLVLDVLVKNPSNIRKTTDKGRQAELVASIKAQGVLQALLVRPLTDGTYEVVDGHRRLAAAKEAGLTDVPCLVRNLNDQAVREAQLVTILQREDLAPMDEAKALKDLLEQGVSYDELASQIGKSKNYIYARMKLLDLHPKVQKALAEGKLLVSWAEMFTRVARLEDQEELLDHIQEGCGPGDLADLKQTIERDYLLRLAKAPFSTKDAKLTEAGACMACQKRSGAQPDLYGEAGKTDTCQDSKCWAQKLQANKEQVLAKAKTGGLEVISGPAAARALDQIDQPWNGSAYVMPTKKAEGVKGKPTWAQATGGKVKEVVLLDPETGRMAKVFKKAEALAAVPPAKLEEHTKSQTPEAKAKEREERAKEMEQDEIEKLTKVFVGKQLFASAGKVKDVEALSLIGKAAAQAICDTECGSGWNEFEEMTGVSDYDVAAKAKKVKTLAELKALVITFLYCVLESDSDKAALAKACGADLKKAKAEAVKQHQEKKAQPAKQEESEDENEPAGEEA